MTVKLSEAGAARVREMQARLNETRSEKFTFEATVEWALHRQYNRQRAVKRHSLSLKNVALEISALEARGARGIDDE